MKEIKIKNNFSEIYSDVDEMYNGLNTIIRIIIQDYFGEKTEALYSVINDKDKFSLLIKILGGFSITLPTEEEFKSAIISALVFYYKEVMHFNWNKIEKLIPYEKDIGLKYASKIRKISDSLKKKIKELDLHKPSDDNFAL